MATYLPSSKPSEKDEKDTLVFTEDVRRNSKATFYLDFYTYTY